MNTKGKHLMADIWLNENIEWKELKNHVSQCLTLYNQTILVFNEWEFFPQGESGVFLLATSHCSVHTYPEHKYITLDVYSCDENFEASYFLKDFMKSLKIDKMNIQILDRGVK